MQLDQQEIVYQIDTNDVLVFVNEQWNLFAAENGSASLVSQYVYNRSIWEFIHDAETRQFHEILLEKVRSGKEIRNLPFRCDSPELRRFMEMDISMTAGEGVEYRCRTIKTEARDPVSLISGNVHDGETFLRMCSWCKKIDTGNQTWEEIEDAIRHLGLFSDKCIPQISHTICETCIDGVENAP
jgi:hypothetical protein